MANSTDEPSLVERIFAELDAETANIPQMDAAQINYAIRAVEKALRSTSPSHQAERDAFAGRIEELEEQCVSRSIVLALLDESFDRWTSQSASEEYRDGYETGITDALGWISDEVAKLPSPPNDSNWREVLGWKGRAALGRLDRGEA